MILFNLLRDRLEHLVVDVRDPFTILVNGEDIFDYYDEVFDELDDILKFYKDQGLTMPRIHIRSARMWLPSRGPDTPARFDTVPDEVLESFCDGLSYSRLVFDFTDLFVRTKNVCLKQSMTDPTFNRRSLS
jgi:hypothetical protein